MLFWHIWYSREAYDEFYKFAQSIFTHYNIDGINKLRLVDVSLGWSRIDGIGEFARMSADQRMVYLIEHITQQYEEFNISFALRDEFLSNPPAGIKRIHNSIMTMVDSDAWTRFMGTKAGQEIFQMQKPRLAPETPPFLREQAVPRVAPRVLRPPAANGLQVAPVPAASAIPFRRPVLPASNKSIAPNGAIPPPLPPLPAVVVAAPANVAARAREIRNVLPASASNAPALVIKQRVDYKNKPLPTPKNPNAPRPFVPRGVPLPPTPRNP